MLHRLRVPRLRVPHLIVGVALGALAVSGAREAGASHDFGDVPDGTFFHDFVDFLVDHNLTAGCGAGQFCPDQAVTRGQQAVFLKKFLGVGSMPQVMDATGRLVGRTTAVNEAFATVALSVQGRLVFVSVGPSGFQASFIDPLFYPGVNDCSGQGYFISSPTFVPASVSFVSTPGHTVYVPDTTSPQIFSNTSGSAGGFGCFVTSATGTGYPPMPMANLDTLFQTPFGLQ